MIDTVRAEWTKLFTTRAWIGLLLGACAMPAASPPCSPASPAPSRRSARHPGGRDAGIRADRLRGRANTSVLLLILGVIGMTQEYRHRTATPTFLTEPRRGRVVAAKLIAYALVAVPFALVILLVDVLVVEIYAGARGAAPPSRRQPADPRASGLVLVVYAVIGVGVGALLRNQVGAIVGSLVYLYVVEPIVSGIGAIRCLQVAARWGAAGDHVRLPGAGPARTVAGRPAAARLRSGRRLLGTFLAVRRDVV